MLNFATSDLDNPPVTASPWQDPLYPGHKMKLQQWRITRSSPHFWAPSYSLSEPSFCRRIKKWHKLHRADMEPSGELQLLAVSTSSTRILVPGKYSRSNSRRWSSSLLMSAATKGVWDVVFGLKQYTMELSSHGYANKFRHKILRLPNSNIWISTLAHCKLPICTLKQLFGVDRYGRHGFYFNKHAKEK